MVKTVPSGYTRFLERLLAEIPSLAERQSEGVPIAGVIIVAEVTPKLRAAASTNPNVRLMRYKVKISLEPGSSADQGRGVT